MTAALREELLAELDKLSEASARRLLSALRGHPEASPGNWRPATVSLSATDRRDIVALVEDLADAGEQISMLVDQALAGEEVIISREGRPLVRLVPCEPGDARCPGALRGQIRIADDFDELPDELAAAFGMPGQ